MIPSRDRLLLDTNVVIYATSPEHPALAHFVEEGSPLVSAVTYVEALGFPRLTAQDRLKLERFFAQGKMLDIERVVLDSAIALRQ